MQVLFSRHRLLTPALCLVVLGTLIFRDFIFGGAVLLYRDIGSDSLNSYFPDFVHLSNYIRHEGWPGWSFHVGMGQDLAYAIGFLLWQPVTWLPENWIAQALVYQHLIKLVLAGLLFFRFLEMRGLRAPAPLLGALLLAFSAYMTMGSCWYPIADEVVCFSAMLLGVEKAIEQRKWILLCAATATVGMINPFYLYLAALLLTCYVPARLLSRHGFLPRVILPPLVSLAIVASLGVALGAFIWIPYLYDVLNSPRGSGAASAVAILRGAPVLGLESTLHYLTAIARTFSNDLLGTGSAFRGWENYFEAPMTYCGLVCLLLLPQVFCDRTRKQRLILVLIAAVLFAPTVFPWLRYLFWLFQGDYFRTYSLFVVLVAITASMHVFSRSAGGAQLHLPLLGLTTAFFLGLLFFPAPELQKLLDPRLRNVAAVYLVLYAATFAAGQLLNRRAIANTVIIVLTATELVFFNQITVANRKTVQKSELRGGLPDREAALGVIKQQMRDKATFFRATEIPQSPLGSETYLNNPMLFDYYSTTSYSSFNNVDYTSFLIALGAFPAHSELQTRWALGTAGNFLLSIFAGEKYVFAEDPRPFLRAPQYESLGRNGRYEILRNNLVCPLGLTFEHYLPEEVFRRLREADKEQVLLASAVLSPEEASKLGGVREITLPELRNKVATQPFPELIEERRRSALRLTSFRESAFEGDVDLAQPSILVLQTPFDRGWRATQDGRPATVLRADIGLLGVVLDSGKHHVALQYRNPYLLTGIAVSLGALVALGVIRWRFPTLLAPQ